MNNRQKAIAELCDGERSSKQIASMISDNVKYVQRTMLALDLPRKSQGAQKGQENSSWRGGRHIDKDGYVTVPSPDGHSSRKIGRIAEHRLAIEIKIGRKLDSLEVVDHIDGLHLHNDPSNLRVFCTNGDHLKATISGQRPYWSSAGWDRMNSTRALRATQPQIHTYRQRKACGDVRLQQILLAALKLGIDSTFLSGTRRHLKKAGIFDLSRSNLERALADLSRKFA